MTIPTVKQAIDTWSNAYGVPPIVLETIAQEESGGNPTQVGDNGTSFGVFQFHKGGGQGDGVPISTLDNVSYESQQTAALAAPVYQQAKSLGLSGYPLIQYVASHTGHPTDTGVMPASYNTQLQSAYQTVLAGGFGGSATTDPSGNLVPSSSGSSSTSSSKSSSSSASTQTTAQGLAGLGQTVVKGIEKVFFGLAGMGVVLLGLYIAFNPASEMAGFLKGGKA